MLPRPRSAAVTFLRLSLFLLLLLAAVPVSAQPHSNERHIPGELLIKFRPTARASERALIRSSLNAQLLHNFGFIGVEHVKIRGISVEAALARYKNHPHVEYVEPNYELRADVVPNDPRFPDLYGMRNTGQTGGTAGADIKATLAWDQFVGDPNIKIGVIDTGVDYNHPDLAANVWTNPGEIPGNGIDDEGNGFVDDVHGYDFANNDGDPFDDNGHGSHVSGTIAGVGNNNVGVVGVNWQAKIVGIKFLSAGGSGSTAAAIQSVNYAITVGVRLTSNSWGGGGFSQALLDAINAAGAAGQLFIAAAGNSSANTDVSPHYPSSYDTPYVVAVAATDHNDNLASFSNFGATTVDLAAPGVAILSTTPGNTYQSFSGTSMATPHVAGVAALAMGRFPNVPALQIKNLILAAADPRPQLAGKCLTGARLNAFMTIAEPDDTPPGAIANLTTSDPGSNTMRLSWTATGDDGATGRATRYEIRYSTSPIDDGNFGGATLVPGGPDPQTAGSAESFEVGGLTFLTTYYFAIKAFDEFNNAGGLSNVAVATTLGAPDIAATPGSFSAELLTGAAETQTLTVRNDAAGTLDFTIPTPELIFSQPIVYPYQPLAKGEVDWRVGEPVTENKGGPDAFGYRWVDSDEPGGPAFDWVDITGVGTLLPVTGDDATSAPVALGIDFPFYGSSFNTARVCTNGFLSFTDASTAYDNQGLPNPGAPANLVAPMWDDMDFGTTPRIYTYNDGARFIVSWIGVPHYQTGGPYTFQALLYPTGEIRFQYLTLASPTNSATAGVQNGTQSIGLTVAFNTNYLKNNHAVRIVPLQQWLTVTPTSGRIGAGQSQDLEVRFNALGLTGGNYAGSVQIESNDPDEGALSLPAQLHVIGAPDLATQPASLDFGEVFVGATPTRNLTVSNPGTDELVVTGITSDDPTVSASPSSFALAPLAARVVTVTYAPTAPAALSATLSIASNDPDTPVKTVPVAGSAVPAPSFTVTPESFDVSLLSNAATTQNLRVQNGGGSNYVFTAEALSFAQSGTVVVGTDADNVFIDKDQVDVLSGPAPLKAGGPDVFGYTYQDSDESGGPGFGWVDIRPVGTQIVMTGDDANTGPFPIGFSFPFYGKNFDTFRVCTNGFISFTSNRTTFSNTSLPNTGTTVPENLLAAFWDDLHFGTANRAWYHYDGTKLVVQYQDVPRRSETPANTFEILIYPNGTIVYQYLSMNAVLKTSATIGIQNEARNDGLQVVFNAAYIKDNLAVRFRPPLRFLTVNPAGGTVPPGGFLDLTVGFNAADLFGGEYNGAVHLEGNDPILPERDVPAHLTVTGVPDIATSPASVDFGNVYVGFPGLKQLTVQNRGTDVLQVSDVVSSNPAYGVDLTSFSVPPLGNAVLFVSFSPPAPGSFPATLSIASNDPDTPTLTVNLTGAGLDAPDIGSTPASLSSSLSIPDTETQTLTVHNTGGSDLNFVIGAQITATSVPIYEEFALGKEEADPRPGILGSGGPDLFGYTWRDSDDPDGPTFDWVDITTIGTPLALTGDDATVAGVTIGFEFPFYGNPFNTVNVCTNGWLSFTSTATPFTNQPLPNTGSGVPPNLLAAFWDDLNPGSTLRIYTYQDGTRFIVSYVGVPRLSSGGPYTFQVILYPTGRIVYQYLDMQGTRLNEATIGIQNGTKTDGLTVVHNAAYMHNNLAIEIRTVPDWLTAAPTSGTIPAGGSAPITVTFNSDDLFAGVYNGSLRISSNDPDEGVFTVPATLTAIGAPDIAAEPASLDFGSLYLGQSRDLTVEIRNAGSDVLTIGSASIGHPSFSLVGATFPIVLGDRGVTTLTVRFAPTQECAPPDPCAGDLVLVSNDPDEGSFAIPLTGLGLIPPEAETDPTSLRAALATTLGPHALTRVKTLRLSNTGGSDLTWTAQALSLLPAALNVTPSAEQGKDDPGEPGEYTPTATGGPDAFGYRWADSDDPIQGTPFEWVDITGVGTPIPFTGDDQNQGPFPLPFPFTYYGKTFTEFRACTNGWISFTSNKTTFTNTTLPNAGSTVPENVLAPFWDDLTFSSAGDVYYHYDGTRFIVSYVNVPRLGTGGGPYTFQIILYPSGTVDFQYLSMAGTRLNEATIGIQNETRDIGLQVVFNANYVKNNLRIRFTHRAGWLTVTPASGTVPADGYVDLAVGFNAEGLADGDFTGALRISSNDLSDPVLDVPCNLHVGTIDLSFDLDPNTLNRSSQGKWVGGYLEPSADYEAQDIRSSSVWLERVVPVAPGSTVAYEDKDEDGLTEAVYKFDRLQLLPLLPDGNNVPVEAIGELEDISWFSGSDQVRVLRPRVTAAAGLEDPGKEDMPSSYPPGYSLELAWEDPEGYTPSYYDIWFSADGGSSWSLLSGGLMHQYVWTVPPNPTTEGLLEIVAMDAEGIMGSWFSPVFTIQTTTTAIEETGTALPKAFGMRLLGANPSTSGETRMELALPASTPVQVRVFDVHGALVRSLVERTLTSGRHPVRWDGMTASGRPAGSGVYFVQMKAAGKSYRARVAVVR